MIQINELVARVSPVLAREARSVGQESLVSVVIPVTGASHVQRAQATVRTLLAQAGCRFEVVVATDSPQTWELSDPRVRVAVFPTAAAEGDKGIRLAQLRNEGVGAAQGDVLCFFDGDILAPEPSYLRTVAGALDRLGPVVLAVPHRVSIVREGQENLIADVVGGASLQDSLRRLDEFRLVWSGYRGEYPVAYFSQYDGRTYLSATPRKEGEVLGPCGHLEKYASTIFGGGIYLHRSVFDAVGGFSEAYVGYEFEDGDLKAKLRKFTDVVELYRITTPDELYVMHLDHPKPYVDLGYFLRNQKMRQERLNRDLDELVAEDLASGRSSYVRAQREERL